MLTADALNAAEVALERVRVAVADYETAVAALHDRQREVTAIMARADEQLSGGARRAQTAIAPACDATALAGLAAVDRVAALLDARRFELVVAAVGERAETLAAQVPHDDEADCRIGDVRAVELAAALRCSPNRARTLAWLARTVTHDLPEVHAALAHGTVDEYRVRLAAEGWRDLVTRCHNAGVAVPESAASAFQQRVLRRSDGSLTEFKRGVTMAVGLLAPRDVQAARTAAKEERCVTVTPGADGMVWLNAYLEVAQAARVMQVLEHAARCDMSLKGTHAHKMADALVAILGGESDLSAQARSAAAEIQILVSAEALASGRLAAAIVGTDFLVEGEALRELLGNSRFRRLLCDVQGRLLDYGRTTYRPPTALADHVRGRDRECRAPGCVRPARYADIDHTVPWQDDGPTDADNLAALCRTHHVLKTHGGWTYQTADDGTTTWTLPSGLTLSRAPADYAELDPPSDHVPDDEECPF